MPFTYANGRVGPSKGAAKRREGGAGTELSKLLSRFGIKDKPGCACKAMAWKMDTNGIDWCRENIAAILAVMKKEATKRRLPFIESFAMRLIERAISKYPHGYLKT